MGIRVEFADGHRPINGFERGHDSQLRGVPHDFYECRHVQVFLLKERIESVLPVVTYEAFRGVPGEADGSRDILVFMDPCGDLFDSLWSGRALPGPSTDPKFLEDENREDVGASVGCLADLVVLEGSFDKRFRHDCWLLGSKKGGSILWGRHGDKCIDRRA